MKVIRHTAAFCKQPQRATRGAHKHILRLLDATDPPAVLFLARFVVDLYHHTGLILPIGPVPFRPIASVFESKFIIVVVTRRRARWRVLVEVVNQPPSMWKSTEFKSFKSVGGDVFYFEMCIWIRDCSFCKERKFWGKLYYLTSSFFNVLELYFLFPLHCVVFPVFARVENYLYLTTKR